MPKVKVPRKSTAIDMTAMCDVAFLLLTFFMLTTKFKPPEAVVINPPSSTSDLKIPEKDLIVLNVDKDGKVYFGVDNKYVRERTLERMRPLFPEVQFTQKELEAFALSENFGVPFRQLPKYLDMSTEERNKTPQAGIPKDSLATSNNWNELGEWIRNARLADVEMRNAGKYTGDGLRIAIKGDGATVYPAVKGVLKTLTDLKINKFNLVTSAEGGALAHKPTDEPKGEK